MGESGVTTVHDFHERLAWSEAQSDEPFWDAVYRKAFPNIVNHMPCPGDTVSQRMGIDRIIFLANGQTLAIDEKKRSTVYDDVFLETVSNDATGAPGWMEKDLAIDYLAYAFMPTKRCYLFPWPLLRRAWLDNKAGWVKKYKVVQAKNESYRTFGVPVPIKDVQIAVARSVIVDVDVS